MDTQRTTILVIDDDEAVRLSLAVYLEDFDYQILIAENGRAGVEIFENETVDLVLVDLRMPEMDGLEVLARIRQTSPTTPLIVVSGTGDIADAVEALRKGAWDYLLKPIEDLSILNHAIENALEKVRLKKENRQYQRHLEQMVDERTKALRQANAHLRESEQQFRMILDHIRTGIVIVEMDTNKVVYVNPTAADMVGTSAPEILGAKCRESLCSTKIGTCPVLDLGKRFDSSERLLKAGDGTQIPILKTITRMTYGGKACLLESFIDLTEQKAAAAEKKALEEQLFRVHKMEAIGTLASGIAHDFNNILSSVIGYTEIALDDELPADTPAKSSLENVLKASLRAKNLVKQILTFSRQTHYEKKPIGLEPIVDEVMKLIRASLPTSIDIRQEIPTVSSSTILGDPVQLHQVLMNLCTNAGYAMRKNGGTLEVALSKVNHSRLDPQRSVDMQPGSYMALSITDSGPGMPSSVLEQVFDPFFTTKPKEEGTGLGLSVVHGIVKDHDGAIWVDSCPDRGTTFRIYLPILAVSPETDVAHDTALPCGNERILVVDDDKAIAEITKVKLERLGYTVEAVSSSRDAFERFSDDPTGFDLVITDQTMPAMTGDQLALKILALRPDIPIILCTGFSHVVDEAQARKMGIQDFIMKPVFHRDLAVRVRRVLDRNSDKRGHGKDTDR